MYANNDSDNGRCYDFQLHSSVNHLLQMWFKLAKEIFSLEIIKIDRFNHSLLLMYRTIYGEDVNKQEIIDGHICKQKTLHSFSSNNFTMGSYAIHQDVLASV